MVEFDIDRAEEVLIEPFKERGEEVLERYSCLLYQNDLFKVVPEDESLEKKYMLALVSVLFDSQKESRKNYKWFSRIYQAEPDYFNLDVLLEEEDEELQMFAKEMSSPYKKGSYLFRDINIIKEEYEGKVKNLFDEDVVETRERIMELPGFGEGLSSLLVHTVRDQGFHTFYNEEDFVPKIDFHDYNIGIVSGIIKNPDMLNSAKDKKEYAYFLNELAKDNEVNIFDLDNFTWIIGQICNEKNKAMCEDYCPISHTYSNPRAFAMENQYRERSTKVRNHKRLLAFQKNLF